MKGKQRYSLRYVSPDRNGGLLTTCQLWQTVILTRDVVDIFFRRHYFSVKYIFSMVCHRIGFIQKNYIPPLLPPFKRVRNIFIPYGNHNKYYNRFSVGTVLINITVRYKIYWRVSILFDCPVLKLVRKRVHFKYAFVLVSWTGLYHTLSEPIAHLADLLPLALYLHANRLNVSEMASFIALGRWKL